jgi:signal transduction histidine kinase
VAATRSDRSTIRDLVALTALPGLWTNQGSGRIATALADAMVHMLRLDLCGVEEGPRRECGTRAVRSGMAGVDVATAETALKPWLDGDALSGIHTVAVPGCAQTPLRVVVTGLGVDGAEGVLIAACQRLDFPTEEEVLLLRVAANLAAVAVREARARDAERAAHREAREAAIVVETINRIAKELSAQTELASLVQFVTDETTTLTGAQFGAFFYNVVRDGGEAYTLYTLSGAPREAFEGFPMPRNTPLFGPTFRGEGIVRVPDVPADPRYGRTPPYHGMPPGHLPVRSYLAVPVVSRGGEVIGGLFFGHSEPDVFSARTEAIMAGVAAQTAIAIDNARLFEEEQRARAVAEAASRAKDEFLAVLSHELRTPLNAVYGWARMLESGQLSGEAVTRAISAITRNAESQMQLIEDMLDVARIVSGKMRLDVRPIDVHAVIQTAIDAVRPAAQAKAIALRATLDDGVPLVAGDPDRLQQVVWNLLINAVKFTPRDGCVDIQVRHHPPHVEVVVRDTGCGIPPDVLPYVFDRFRQGESGSARPHGGLGLGLALVRHLVELHGGTVGASSAGEHRGATFTVRLPIGLAEVGERNVPTALRASDAARLPRSSLRGVRVLVVDDHADSRELVAAMLATAGAETRGCASALEGYAELIAWRPDVLVSDLEMPGEDGYALLRRVRRLDPDRGGRTPSVALTAYDRVADRERTRAAGYDAHLPKPVDPIELATTIARVVRVC